LVIKRDANAPAISAGSDQAVDNLWLTLAATRTTRGQPVNTAQNEVLARLSAAKAERQRFMLGVSGAYANPTRELPGHLQRTRADNPRLQRLGISPKRKRPASCA
jgi:hypothetical protein